MADTETPYILLPRKMKAYVELKVAEEREDFPSEDESSSSEGEEEEAEDEDEEGRDVFVVRGFMSDTSDE